MSLEIEPDETIASLILSRAKMREENKRLMGDKAQLLAALTELERCTRQFLNRELVTMPSALLPTCRQIIAQHAGK